jgi:tetratricopeptide (TPR) repeat protein
MDIQNPVIQLCIEGNRAEFEGRIDEARSLFWQAWKTSRDDFDACIAAHYVARHQQSPQETLRWNREALNRADAVGDERVQSFYPSLYVNLGRSYELLDRREEAERYFKLAADLGLVHQSGQGPDF